MRWTLLAWLLACACGLVAGCSIDRAPPRVVSTSERVQAVDADSDADEDDDSDERRLAGYTAAALRDGGFALGAQAGSGATPPEDTDEDAGIGCDPSAR